MDLSLPAHLDSFTYNIVKAPTPTIAADMSSSQSTGSGSSSQQPNIDYRAYDIVDRGTNSQVINHSLLQLALHSLTHRRAITTSPASGLVRTAIPTPDTITTTQMAHGTTPTAMGRNTTTPVRTRPDSRAPMARAGRRSVSRLLPGRLLG